MGSRSKAMSKADKKISLFKDLKFRGGSQRARESKMHGAFVMASAMKRMRGTGTACGKRLVGIVSVGWPGTASLRGDIRVQASRRLWNPPNSLMRERPLSSLLSM